MVSQVSYKAINLVSTNGSISITDLANGDTNLQTAGGGGSGTVTSVGLTAPSIFTVGGSPVTTSGTLALTYSGTALPIANGGTGETTATGAFNRLSGYTVNSSASVSLSAASTYNQFFIGGSSSATLPDVTTLTLGYTFHIVNQTSSTLLVDADGTTIFLIPINTGALFTCIRVTIPQDTAWVYATSDLWSTGDGSSGGNTGITGTGAAVHTSGATLSNVANLSTNGPTLLQNGSGSMSIVDGGSTASTLQIIGQTASLGRNRIFSSPTLRITAGSTNPITFRTAASATDVNGDGNEQFRVAHTASAVNYVQVTGSTTTSGLGIATVAGDGTATNVDVALTPKAAGRVRFGSYTATLLTQTGFIEIKDSGGTTRRLLVG